MSFAKAYIDASILGLLNRHSPRQKTVWYRMRHGSGAALVDAMGNGPDLTVNGTTAAIWSNAKTFTASGNNYTQSIGNAYLQSLFAMESLYASGGILFFAADIYPASASPTNTQTIFQMGGGTGSQINGHPQAMAFTQHLGTGKGRIRLNDQGVTISAIAETAAALSVGSRNALCGYVDMQNKTVGVSANGTSFVVSAPFASPVFNDAAMNEYGLMNFAQNGLATLDPPPITPTQFVANTVQLSGLFITRFESHPGLDFIAQLAADFNDTIGAFPANLITGRF